MTDTDQPVRRRGQLRERGRTWYQNQNRPKGGSGLAGVAFVLWIVALLAVHFWAPDSWRGLFHTLWIISAIALLIGAILIVATDRKSAPFLLASAGLSFLLVTAILISLLVNWIRRNDVEVAPDVDLQPTATAPADPDGPLEMDGANGAEPNAGDPPPAADASPNVAVPGEQYLEDQRAEAARLGEESNGMDFVAPYTDAELRAMENWELKYLRDNPNDAEIVALARQHDFGLGNDANGNDLADWLQDEATLRTVGADGLTVRRYNYEDGKVVFQGRETLPAGTAVWYHDGSPVATWRDLHRLKESDPGTK